MKKLRVLIVDDEFFFRSLIRNCLEALEEVHVVGIAQHGEDALKKIEALNPDVITLDMDMPKLDGLGVLRGLQGQLDKIRAIVIGGADKHHVDQTLEALEIGAFDCLIKPDLNDEAGHAILKKELAREFSEIRQGVRRIQAKSSDNLGVKGSAPVVNSPIANSKVRSQSSAVSSPARPDIVAIGSSTGGPHALQALLSSLPSHFPLPITVTQHMPKLFLNSLAARIDSASGMQCVLAEEGMSLEAGVIYIAPGDRHMEIVKQGMKLVVQLNDAPKVHHCRPAVDITFDSLAVLAPNVKTLAMVLTGMGIDGAAGAKKIAEKKGHVIAQDEQSSVVWGMPGETVRLGAAHDVLPLKEMGAALIAHCCV